ncbi:MULTISPECIES: DNA topoisomerase IB [Subtercola]|uniref:DNA topoisomerase IB n=1 Tax=Subtercola vilae TaxID=2056433 RepID=A0A4T2C5D3_9MICO|nr:MULTISPECIES: DNA topoisomerase IB [Subtercola]MEA9984571.1 DNA topoisomerase IB [Subtercola sp. RTI3]TIH39367.1 DNA topoisomerase IB [Subtercola vilae]
MRLRRSDLAGKGFRRVRAGTRFTYRDPSGEVLRDAELRERIRSLGIPPAWEDVWIAPHPNGHIQATGIDGAGRRQYIYHPTWREQKDRIKFDRALSLAEALPTARRKVTLDLRREQPDRERALAAGFRMLDTGSLRVGSERYAAEHGSRGLSTLLCAHASVHGDTIHLEFPAKSGKDWASDIRDAELAAVIRGLKRRGPHAHLLAFKEKGRWHPVSGPDINEYVRAQTGGEFTAKDFRTLHGTAAAAVSLAKSGPQQSARARSAALSQAMRDAASVLSNTPTIARASYVDPRLVDRFAEGRTIDPARLGSVESELRALLFE